MQTDDEVYGVLTDSWTEMDTVEQHGTCDTCLYNRADVERRDLDFVPENMDPSLRKTVFVPDTEEDKELYKEAKQSGGVFYGGYVIHCQHGCTVEELYTGPITVRGSSYVPDQASMQPTI